MSAPPTRRLARGFLVGAALALTGLLGPILCSGESASTYLSIGGLLLVGLGVVAVAFLSYDAADVRRALHAVAALPDQAAPVDEVKRREIANLLRWAHLLRDGEVRRLEREAGEGAADPLVRYGLNMILGEHGPADVRAMLATAAARSQARDERPIDVLHAMAGHAPAFGMVGTLVGMVATLSRLDADPSGIGATLALSFLSTLYGLLCARLLYMPAAARLERRADDRRALDALLVDGLVLLAERRTSIVVNDRLNGHLDPGARDYIDTVATSATPAARAAVPRRRIGLVPAGAYGL